MKILPLLFLILPLLGGCMATGNLIAFGKKSEFRFAVDEVSRSRSEPSYLVTYTATVGLATIGGGHFPETRYQILTPGQPPPPRVKTKPSSFADGGVPVPIQRTHADAGPPRLPTGQLHLAQVAGGERIVLLTREAAGSPVVRTDLSFTTLEYREPFAYPLMIIGLPVALAFDTVTFPVQVVLLGSAFSHPGS